MKYFNKTFFKFATGFLALLAVGVVGILVVANAQMTAQNSDDGVATSKVAR